MRELILEKLKREWLIADEIKYDITVDEMKNLSDEELLALYDEFMDDWL
jgi:hypothetical protein